MTYSTNNNQIFHERMQKLMGQLYEVAFAEGVRLDNIYTNEAESGSAPEWQDTNIATAAECVEAVVLIRALQSWLTDNWHVARMTPFIQ